jgi:hypothetical protein
MQSSPFEIDHVLDLLLVVFVETVVVLAKVVALAGVDELL